MKFELSFTRKNDTSSDEQLPPLVLQQSIAMTDKLPPNLLALFAPRPALRYLPPSDHAPEARRTHEITGVAAYLDALKDYEKIPYTPTESWLQKKERKKAEKKERQAKLATDEFKECES